jgi:hypothetical protein
VGVFFLGKDESIGAPEITWLLLYTLKQCRHDKGPIAYISIRPSFHFVLQVIGRMIPLAGGDHHNPDEFAAQFDHIGRRGLSAEAGVIDLSRFAVVNLQSGYTNIIFC